MKAMLRIAVTAIFCIVFSLCLFSEAAFAYNIGDDYPNKDSCAGCHSIRNGDDHNDFNDRLFYYRQCTDFVAWCLRSRNGLENFSNSYGGVTWSNAGNWKNAAESLGVVCNNTPAIGAVACWTSGEFGHVAWVEAVNGDEVIIEEYNYGGSTKYNRRPIPADDPTCYIHIKDIDDIAPIINVARIQNKTSEGFDVVVEAVDNVGVSAIKIGTWHSRMSIDNAVWSPEVSPNQNGRVILHVSYSDFSNTSGAVFYTNAYAIDAAGNWSEAVLCYSFEDLGDDFYATIILDSNGGFWENNSNQIIISEDTGYAFDTDPIHIWHFIKQKTGDYAGSYEIISEYNDRCVDINSFGFEEGTSVGLLERAHNAAQRFYICLDTRKGYPRYYFRSSYCNKVLDVHGSVTEPGGIIWLWTPNYSDAQLFQINDLADSGLNYPGSVPPPTPTIQKSISGQNATLSWSSPDVNQFDSRAYHVSLYTGSTASGTALYDNANTTDTSHTFSLEPGTYTLKVTAINTKYENLVAEASYTFSMTGSYTVTYDANNGTGAPASQSKTPGATLTLSNDKPSRADENAGSYTITLDANGGTVSPTSLSSAITTSYTFLNWNTKRNGSGTSYAPGDNYTADTNVTLYAQWKGSTAAAELVLSKPSRSGYVFMGWLSSKGTTTTQYAPGVPYRPNGSETLSAVWKQITFALPANLTTVEDDAFAGIKNCVVRIPDGVTYVSPSAFDSSVTLVVSSGSAAAKAVKNLGLAVIEE